MGMDYRHAVLATDPRVWDTLDKHERVSVLQALENHAADWQGRLPRTVTPRIIPSEQGSHNFGYYDHYRNPDKLFLNEQDLDNIDETLDTLFHEGQHAYQHDCVDGKIIIPEPIRQQFDNAFRNYVPPEQDPRAYANNYAERDAREEAQRALMRLENERTIYQKNAHDIETTSDSLETLPENSKASTHISSESTGHEVTSKIGPTIPWADEEDTHPEKVKILGGRDMVTRVSSDADMSYDEKMQLCTDRLRTDGNAFSDNLRYMTSEDRTSLRNDIEKELYSYHGLQACYSKGDAEGFDLMYDSFINDSSCFRQNYEQRYYRGLGFNNEGIASKSEVVADENQHPTTHEDTKPLTKNEEASLRRKAIDGAWEREKELVQNGNGTRDWTVEQQAELLKEGYVTGFEGSHMMSVKDYPEYAGNPDNIQFLPSVAHFEGVHQGDSVRVHPNGRFDENTGEVIPAKDDQIPEQPVIELSDKYDPSQEEYHRSTPEMEQSGQKRHDDYYSSKENHPEKSQRIGFRASPEEEYHEEIVHTAPKDQIEDTQAEKTPEESSNNHEEATEAQLPADNQSAQKQVKHQENQLSKHADEASMADQESESESNLHTSSPNNQGNKTSEQPSEASEPSIEQTRNKPEQNNDHSGFWSTVPRNTALSDIQSNSQEYDESNSVSM